jgi:NADH-ubiquinone oxidoreductase chain 6
MIFFFYLFSSLAVFSGILVIQARNPVHSVLFLILVFFNAAGLLLLVGLDFFALIFLVVYVGAIAVLFLFVVMMLNIKMAEINEKKLRYLPIGGVLGFLFLFEVFLIVDNDLIPLVKIREKGLLSGAQFQFTDWSIFVKNTTNIEALGESFYTFYFFYFLLAGIILLVAMIGAIVLTMHKGVHIKRQEIFEQNSREFAKTVQMVKNSSSNSINSLLFEDVMLSSERRGVSI